MFCVLCCGFGFCCCLFCLAGWFDFMLPCATIWVVGIGVCYCVCGFDDFGCVGVVFVLTWFLGLLLFAVWLCSLVV